MRYEKYMIIIRGQIFLFLSENVGCAGSQCLFSWSINIKFNNDVLLTVMPWVVLYFFGYKTGDFSFQNKILYFLNNPKDLDPSCKMDLDLSDCVGRVKLVLLHNFIGLV